MMNINQHHPGSIRNRILIFSILVTLLPSVGMGWFWYDISRETMTSKVEQMLNASANIIEREVGLWFRERVYDLRVLSGSFVIVDNLTLCKQLAAKSGSPSAVRDEALKKLKTYLDIIFSKFRNYHRFAILDAQGDTLVAAGGDDPAAAVGLPPDWREQVERKTYFLGEHFQRSNSAGPLILLGMPLLAGDDGECVGFFVLETSLDAVRPYFEGAFPWSGIKARGSITLLENPSGVMLRVSSALPDEPDVLDPRMLDLFSRPGIVQEFTDTNSHTALGLAYSLIDLPWSLLIEVNRDDVYADLIEARNKILLITGLLTVAIGGMAILLARRIIVPLQELTKGVQQVAQGNLQIAVPIIRTDEFGIVSAMFNEMVSQLLRSRIQLEELATTDPLTGLANRKHFMAELEFQFEGYRRHATSFSLLMLDIDFFKKINDTYGHLGGDHVLVGVADILRVMLRKLDTVGRYGGEEFLVILDATDQEQAMHTAERIRHAVEEHVFSWHEHEFRITVSIGGGTVSTVDETPADLIARVDAVLYRAKQTGRNRICYAE